MSLKSHYNIPIPPDNKGYVHRLCPNCGIKFGIRSIDRDFLPSIFCPYCESKGNLSDFNVPEQLQYATHEGLNQIEHDLMRHLQDTMKKSLRGSKNVKFKPARLTRNLPPTLQQADIPTDMTCSLCAGLYEIYGIASKCPFCGNEDIKIMEANIAHIEKELQSDRAVRHIYNDLVITFQNLCRFYALKENIVNFQNINLAEKYFEDNYSIDLLSGVDLQNLKDMRTAFEKRHKEQHTGGIIDQKYVDVLGLDISLIGQKVSYSRDELTSALKALVKINNNLRSGIPKL